MWYRHALCPLVNEEMIDEICFLLNSTYTSTVDREWPLAVDDNQAPFEATRIYYQQMISFCLSIVNASISSALCRRLIPFKVVFPHTPSTLRPQFSWFTYFFVKRQCGATSLRNRVINAAKFAVIKISFEHSTHIQTDRRSCCSSIAPCALFTLTRDYSKTVAHFCC